MMKVIMLGVIMMNWTAPINGIFNDAGFELAQFLFKFILLFAQSYICKTIYTTCR
jgi:hypothetical protein